MDWYYAENDQPQGPFTDVEFWRRADDGVLTSDTLVWNESMPEWVPFREISADSRPEPEVEVVEGSVGQETSASPEYADFAQRAAAKVLDQFILVFIFMALLQLTGTPLFDGPLPETLSSEEPIPGATGTARLLFILINAVYEILFLTLYSATPGKIAFRMRVIFADGRSMTPLRAVFRFGSEFITQHTLLIGYFIALLNPERRTLHDMICGSRVVHNSSTGASK